MAHCGLFVPAETCRLSACDRLDIVMSNHQAAGEAEAQAAMQRATMHTASSVPLNSDGSFVGQCRLVLPILAETSRHSLCLIDEFGQSTLPSDGTALLAVLIQHLLAAGPDCPKCIITTHLHAVITQRLVDQSDVRLQLSHMQSMTKKQAEQASKESSDKTKGSAGKQKHSSSRGSSDPDVDDDLLLTYRCVSGAQSQSYAAHCMRQAEMPEDIVARAKQVRRCLDQPSGIRTVQPKAQSTQKQEHQEAEEPNRSQTVKTEPQSRNSSNAQPRLDHRSAAPR